jgi:NRPS condensation-like uncharacterized protein
VIECSRLAMVNVWGYADMPKNMKYRAAGSDILQHLFKKKKINDRTIRFAATFSGNLDFACLRKAVGLSAEAFPLLRSGFKVNKVGASWEVGDYPVDAMAELTETEDADAAVWGALLKEADEINGPQLKISVIRCGETDTLCLNINHMICDAAGCKEYIYWLSSIYENVRKKPDFRPEALTGKRNLGQIVKTFSWTDRIRIFSGSNDMKKHGEARFDLEGDQIGRAHV